MFVCMCVCFSDDIFKFSFIQPLLNFLQFKISNGYSRKKNHQTALSHPYFNSIEESIGFDILE